MMILLIHKQIYIVQTQALEKKVVLIIVFSLLIFEQLHCNTERFFGLA